MPEIAYVNGEFLPLERATVRVQDRGFQFADGVYEVVRTYNGKPFATAEHLARLARSLEAIELKNPLGAEQWTSIIDEGIRRSGFAEAIVYLQITRGYAPRHRGMPKDVEPTIVMTVRPLGPPATKIRETGIGVITVPEFRWARCDIKSIALLPSVLAYQAAKKAGANDAIFVGDDDTVNESTAGNVFVVTRGRLRTPPKSTRILPGVTRDKLLEAARAAGVETAEERVIRAELYLAEEMFLTSTTAEVTPVVTVDGKQISTGKPGPISAKVYDQFARMFIRK
ncbi:MAG: D-amino acid aminotransferase [Verrucomicrobiia bacterium]|jgi:D-alanine transaminase